jgi:hypothetical protein
MYLTWQQIVGLFVLAIPIACVARTVTAEEIFREPREWCLNRSKTCRGIVSRKFFYLFTCEYCFSHWVTAAFMLLTGYRLMYGGFRGVIVGFFSLVFVANIYMSLFSRLRVEITSEKKEIEAKDRAIEKLDSEIAENKSSSESAATRVERILAGTRTQHR